MAARCQACEIGVKTLPNGTGVKGRPFGACSNCDSFTCGHHGHRDGNVPEFMCVECDPSLLAASAAVATGTAIGVTPPDQGGTRVQAMLAGYRAHTLPFEVWVVRSPDDFLRRRPGYGEGLRREVESRRRDYDFNAWVDVPREAQELLVMARAITQMLEIPEHHVPRFLR